MVDVVWQHRDDTSFDTGPVVFEIKYIGVADGENAYTAGTTITQADAEPNLKDIQITTTFATKLLASNLAQHDSFGFKLTRLADDSGDTMSDDVDVIAVHLHFTENTLGKDVNP